MSKEDLLAHLPPYPTNPRALALARQRLSDADVEKLRGSLLAREKKLGLLDTAIWTWLVLLILAFFAMVAEDSALNGRGVLASLLLLVAGVGARCYLGLPLSLLPQLEPLQGTDLCEKALELVNSGAPGVVEWRRVALAERDQLYAFDYSVMNLLWGQHFLAMREADRQVALDKACRALHEIPQDA